MVRSAVLLVAIIGCGCSLPPLPKDIYIESRFTTLERQLIEDAIRETNAILLRPCLGFDGLVYRGTYVDQNGFDADGSDLGDDRHVVYKVRMDDLAYATLTDLAEDEYRGYATVQDVLLMVEVDVPGAPDDGTRTSLTNYKRLVRHELGHHVGLLHNPDEGALMFAGRKSVDTFSVADRAAFAFAQQCQYGD